MKSTRTSFLLTLTLIVSGAGSPVEAGPWRLARAQEDPAPVKQFTIVTADPAAQVRVGDFDGDGRDDLVAYIKKPGAAEPLALNLADANGGFDFVSRDPGDFKRWINASDVKVLTGDFQGDGRTDLALVRLGPGWGTVPVASFGSNGNWSVTNGQAGAFAGWAAQADVEAFAGRFDRTPGDDILLIRRSPGWGTLPLALSDRQGGWRITNKGAGQFPEWAAQSGTRPLVGDFNGDGLDDVALIKLTPGWGTIPVALSDGSGGWQIHNRVVPSFVSWATQSGVEPLVGDFDDDGHDDIALVRSDAGWSTVPIAFGEPGGRWRVTNGPAPDFARFAALSGAQPIIGDVNGDKRDDIVLVRKATGWRMMPTLISDGSGGWQIRRHLADPFTDWAAQADAAVHQGDFNNDGRLDIALSGVDPVRAGVPIAFANDEPRRTRPLIVMRHTGAAITDGQADAILKEMSNVLLVYDRDGDFACPVEFVRLGAVGTFTAPNASGSVVTGAQRDRTFAVRADVRVVPNLSTCVFSGFNPGLLGCGPLDNGMIVERLSGTQTRREGSLWAHEFGHNRGLLHGGRRDDIMGTPLRSNNVMTDPFGCNLYRNGGRTFGEARSSAMTVGMTLPLTEVAGQETAIAASGTPETLEALVRGLHPEGLPLASIARRFGPDDAEPLRTILSDPDAAEAHGNAALALGLIGEAGDRPLLETAIRRQTEGEPTSGNVFSTMAGLGILSGRTGDEDALDILQSLSAGGGAMAQHAVLSIALAGTDAARARLDAIAAQADPDTLADVLEDARTVLETVDELGIVGYYAQDDR